jgi:hypothetical protein
MENVTLKKTPVQTAAQKFLVKMLKKSQIDSVMIWIIGIALGLIFIYGIWKALTNGLSP